MRIFSTISTAGLTLASMLIAALVPMTAGAVGIQVMVDGQAVTFSDVQTSIWFATYVRQAAEAGALSGYQDAQGHFTGKFGPGNDITIAEALKIAVKGAGYNADLYGSLVDSGVSDHWATSFVAVAKGENFPFMIERASLDRPATRAEVASIFASAFRADLSTATPVDTRYTDVNTSTKFASAIEALSRDEVLSGDTDTQGQKTGTFRPKDKIKRAEVAKMVIEARAKYGEPGTDRKPDDTQHAEENTVTYTTTGFSPAVLRVKSGTTVTFVNDSTEDLRVASNPHPSHTDLPGFDSLTAFGQGETYQYTFTRLGTWGYHNHLRPSFGATIIVE